MSDLIVVDEFYDEVGTRMRRMAKSYRDILNNYKNILTQIRDTGLCSGETANALDQYIQLTFQLGDCAMDLGQTMDVAMEHYIKSIDEKDKYIF